MFVNRVKYLKKNGKPLVCGFVKPIGLPFYILHAQVCIWYLHSRSAAHNEAYILYQHQDSIKIPNQGS